jgi:hypothetical protein
MNISLRFERDKLERLWLCALLLLGGDLGEIRKRLSDSSRGLPLGFKSTSKEEKTLVIEIVRTRPS